MFGQIGTRYLRLFEYLGLLHILTGVKKIFEITDKEIADHESSFQPEFMRDFTDCYIDQKILHETDATDQKFAKQNLRNIYADLFFAGSETTSSTLKWALLFMVLYPEVQQKVRVTNHYQSYKLKLGGIRGMKKSC
jgi:cytochrome P450